MVILVTASNATYLSMTSLQTNGPEGLINSPDYVYSMCQFFPVPTVGPDHATNSEVFTTKNNAVVMEREADIILNERNGVLTMTPRMQLSKIHTHQHCGKQKNESEKELDIDRNGSKAN